ncbi:FADH2 O2-dependent halogenase I [Paraglaciecola mesophila KMM 241]|uniref:FADH2 O2-dependent halogenase I n=1 Tax=Paraglaciecola mesophila KMM 241 TaxID=1128912 RepID=K6Z1Z9_9ALTE|nr:tryptophan halogenase family protein [Paraglaciecola mesophila]GAC24417.1 FADH2 O2-dependent halogenase I [Paraglaciecola mesophila KMM 241]|tara:strand:- start:2154 stop:3644 length:1491 start_codon:yes stop_codon:yes gene_type:complete
MKQVIKNVVIVGGGTAGWLTAALLQKVVGTSINITLVESEAIGTVGVGEATIPPIRLVNQVLGINEAEFLRETKATIKLAIKFENWRTPNESYFHTFGSPGKSMAFCHFHHFVNRAKNLGHESTIWDYDLNYLCATQGKFAHIKAQDPVLDLPYAYHFDASLYAQFLRRYCQKLGAKRIEGMIESVQQHPSGDIAGVTLQDGQQIHGDLFVDCSGFRGLLIQQTLGVGYDDWTHLLPCDRAVAVPSERFDKTVPYTRAIAHKAGWQWRIPLQHRNGNGLVYCSSHMSDDEATHSLLNNLDSTPIGDPKVIHFKTGRRRKQWHKNVVAVGLASGFLEPLESTSIHLIQSAIVRLIHLFPHQGIDSAAVDEFNHQSELEYTQIRDFLVLHYHLTERDDSQFWRNIQSMDIPASLAHKMALFKQTGKLFREQNDLFLESSWLQVMVGQGIEPNDYHPIANNLSEPQLLNMLNKMCEVKQEPLTSLPSHDEFLKHFCKVT